MANGPATGSENFPQGNGSDQDIHEKLGETVTLYRYIPQESVTDVLNKGITIESHELGNPALEDIFSEEATKRGIQIDRRSAIFAYPRHPSQMRHRDVASTNQVLIKFVVDPGIIAIVTDSATYGEAERRFDRGELGLVPDWAGAYWDQAKTLKEYLSEGHNGGVDDVRDFDSPEVLIAESIPNDRITVINE